MSEDKGSSLFTPGSLQTFIAASFIIALLALGMTIYNFTRTTQAVSGILDLQLMATKEQRTPDLGDLPARIEVLEEKVKTLEAAQAAPPPAPPAGGVVP